MSSVLYHKPLLFEKALINMAHLFETHMLAICSRRLCYAKWLAAAGHQNISKGVGTPLKHSLGWFI